MRDIRVLLVEGCLEDARFIQEALQEIQESAQQGDWTSFRITHVEGLDEASAMAVSGDCDLILMNPKISGVAGPVAFAALHSAAPTLPIVLIVDRAEEPLAQRLLREGAQDYLLRDELDCGPLAHALRNAIERQRFATASSRANSFDELTGLYNERGFHAAATRELHLAAGASMPLLISIIEIDNLCDLATACGPERRDMTILDATEVLRAGAGELALLACLRSNRFAAMVWNMRPEGFIARLQTKLGDRPRDFGFAFGWTVTKPGTVQSLDLLIAAAEARLCENKQSYQTLPEPSLLTRRTASGKTSRE